MDDCVTCSCVNASVGVTCSNAMTACDVTCDSDRETMKYVEGECCPVCGELHLILNIP